jgi:hypothetical protein
LFEPVLGGGGDLIAGTFVVGETGGGVVVEVEGAVVDVEAAAEAEAAVEDEAADEGGGAVVGFLEDGGEGGEGFGEGDAVILDAVREGVSGGEEGGVGGEGEWIGSADLGEEGARFGEGIDVGGGVVGGLIAGEVIGAEGIDGDEDNGGEEEEEVGEHLIRL